ncbi:hypothetical protein L195_g038895 [Trifolium pratense]|uniref:RNase H type-1 domain-containing protein n=1 Tax=Trifolium pratense TaxID=57577 RepID=A0A2K3LWG3_TRIPR|nr:hypothetical protein L195_g038895 [Trifolium pratense]
MEPAEEVGILVVAYSATLTGDLAWKERISHLIMESDSKILIDMMMDNKFNGMLPTLVWHIRNVLTFN